MPKVFLTGKPRVGKTTVLLKCIEFLKEKGIKVSGILTPEIREEKRIGFKVVDINSGESKIFASKFLKQGIKFGSYRMDLEKFEAISLPALKKALKESEVICIDEIGKMELMSKKFQEILKKVLSSEKNLIATLHRHLIKEFESFGEIITVTEKNRDKLPPLVLKILKIW